MLNNINFTKTFIIVIDEYYNYPNWIIGPNKAFHEFVVLNNLTTECIGFVPGEEQAAFKLTKNVK